jgi:methionyl-tRNA formyltransferase
VRLVVVGQKWLGAEAARALAAAGHHLLAVAVPRLDDRLALAGRELGVDVAVAEKRLQAAFVPLGTELIVCAHAHCFVDGAARARARHGAIGYHPSLLPRHRGRSAIEWALRFGDPVTGGTVYELDDGADTGPILAQDWCWIAPGDSAELLWRRDLAPMGLRLLTQAVADIARGHAVRLPQRPDVATFEPAITAARLGPA